MNWARELFEKYRSQKGVADICGVILYTDAHANIKRFLADDIFWTALDEMSGPLWAIYAIKPSQGKYEVPDLPKGTLGYMVPIWKEPKENKLLLEEFEIESTKEVPCLICFTHDRDGEILKIVLKIDDTTLDSVYNSFKQYITLVTKSIEQINIENIDNPLGVYSAVYQAIHGYKNWEKMKKGIKYLNWIKKLLPLK